MENLFCDIQLFQKTFFLPDSINEGDEGEITNALCPMLNLNSESLQDIAAAMPTAGYAYANKIAKLTKVIKIQTS